LLMDLVGLIQSDRFMLGITASLIIM